MDRVLQGAQARATQIKKTNKQKLEDQIKSKSCNFGINLVMCVLCIVSVSSSVWRELDLKTRLTVLEDRVAFLEVRSDKGMDGFVERFRREAVFHLKRRVMRDVGPVRSQEGRRSRDVPECVCPAGTHNENEAAKTIITLIHHNKLARRRFIQSLTTLKDAALHQSCKTAIIKLIIETITEITALRNEYHQVL
ncbi:hypothetical protein JTB14_026924 [Gonioctena quinquepunctata]|nr:hypothetical protein JTB14_026924 [Gonioctena quinquepunctata]